MAHSAAQSVHTGWAGFGEAVSYGEGLSPSVHRFFGQGDTGETWHFQARFRDGNTSNFTDGLAILFR